MFETKFFKDGKMVKVLRMFPDKNKTIVQELELREIHGEDQWIPVHMNVHDKFVDARTEWMGRLNMIGYENANPSTAPFEGIFRNSLAGL